MHAKQIKEGLIRAYKKLNHLPEVYSYDEELIDFSREPTIEGVRANPIQAMSIGSLLNMIWKEG